MSCRCHRPCPLSSSCYSHLFGAMQRCLLCGLRSVLRHVAMQGLHAEQQRTSMWYKAGGAVYLYQSNITVHNSIFKNNYGVWGGAIAMQDAKPSEIIGCSFIFNSAFDPKTRAAHGGAILVLDSEQVSISASKFVSNTALSGGALLVRFHTLLRRHLCFVASMFAVLSMLVSLSLLGGGFSLDSGRLVCVCRKFR